MVGGRAGGIGTNRTASGEIAQLAAISQVLERD
jgi:hypothetical protein